MNSGESSGSGCKSSVFPIAGPTVRRYVAAPDRFSVLGDSTAQPANSSVKSATIVRLTVLRFNIVFFMSQPYRCKQIPAVARVRDFAVQPSR